MSETYFFLIPARTEPSACKSCGQRIYWIEHTRKPRNKDDRPTPKPLPVSVKHDFAIEPTWTTWGRGVSHFSDCPHAQQHRKGAPVQPIVRQSPGGPVHAKLELVS